MTTRFQRWLRDHDACAEARAWVGDKDAATAWAQCENPDWMLWFLRAAGVDYAEATAQALRAYSEATAPAWRAYSEAAARALRAYDEARVRVLRAYSEATARALRAREEAVATARRAYADGIRCAYPCCPVEV